MRPKKKKSEVLEEADSLFNWIKRENEKFFAENRDVVLDINLVKAQSKMHQTFLEVAGEHYELYDC